MISDIVVAVFLGNILLDVCLNRDVAFDLAVQYSDYLGCPIDSILFQDLPLVR